MAIIDCPECKKTVSDKALTCPSCGFAIGGRFLGGYEYRSEAKFLGIPLVHIVLGHGINPVTGRIRIAKGIIAIGNMAIGGVAIGGLSLGAISIGGLAVGLASLGGMTIGLLLALGGMAIGFIAIGGGAIGYYALGGGAFGAHPLGGNQQDPQAIEFFKKFLGPWVEQLKRSG
jgi:hypothetical protein